MYYCIPQVRPIEDHITLYICRGQLLMKIIMHSENAHLIDREDLCKLQYDLFGERRWGRLIG